MLKLLQSALTYSKEREVGGLRDVEKQKKETQNNEGVK
jgi:hypothetical protein